MNNSKKKIKQEILNCDYRNYSWFHTKEWEQKIEQHFNTVVQFYFIPKKSDHL